MPTPDLSRLAEYNCIDSGGTLNIATQLWEELNSTGYRQLYDFYVRLHEPLLFMMAKGIRVDQAALSKVLTRVNKELEEKKAELNRIAGRELNALSPQQCIQYFYIERNIPAYIDSKTKRPTTNDTAMARLAKGTSTRDPIPEARLVQEIRGLTKLKGTYLEIEFDDDNRMRCAIKPRGTRFARLSTGKTTRNTGMNMQNLPTQFKAFLVPDPGKVFLEFDKKQAEWVVTAYAAGDANMIKVIEDGLDTHVHTAHLMFRCAKSLIEEDNELVGHLTDPVEIRDLRERYLPQVLKVPFVIRNMSMRQAGKKSNHGLNYDERFRTFALYNELLENDAKKMVNLYHDSYPGIRLWYERIQNRLAEDRTLVNCFGRKYKFLDKWGHDLFKKAYSFLPQSTVGDLINGFGHDGGIVGMYYDQENLALLDLLMNVHDSILMQSEYSDTRRLAEACILVGKYLDPVMEYEGREFRIENELKIGSNWEAMKKVPLSDDVEKMKHNLDEALNELQRTSRLDSSLSEVHG